MTNSAARGSPLGSASAAAMLNGGVLGRPERAQQVSRAGERAELVESKVLPYGTLGQRRLGTGTLGRGTAGTRVREECLYAHLTGGQDAEPGAWKVKRTGHTILSLFRFGDPHYFTCYNRMKPANT